MSLKPQDYTEKMMTGCFYWRSCAMWSIPFNNASESHWKSGSMELFLAITHPFFTNKKRHKFCMKRYPTTLNKYSGEMKVFDLPVNGVSYLSGFKLHLSAEMRSYIASWICFDKLGTFKICRALCSKVGFFFIISKSQCLVWLPCCNSSSFSGFLSHIVFHFQRNHLKRRCLLPSPPLEVTLWAMMWWSSTRDNILTCTLLV